MGEENEEKTCKLGTGDPRNWESGQEWGGGRGGERLRSESPEAAGTTPLH